jgi:NADH-quinone oxidoreductase subunit E
LSSPTDQTRGPLSDAARAAIQELVDRYPSRRSALIPSLMRAQEDAGYLSPAVMEEVATLVGLQPVEVEGVASFYTLLHRRPVGRHVIQICTNIACHLRGARGLLQHTLDTLGIPLGGMTPDGLFTVERVECIAACGGAPAIQVNLEFHENMTPERMDALLAELRAQEVESRA